MANWSKYDVFQSVIVTGKQSIAICDKYVRVRACVTVICVCSVAADI